MHNAGGDHGHLSGPTHRRQRCALAYYQVLVLETLDEAVDRLANRDRVLPELWRTLDLLRAQPVRIRLPDRLVSGIGAGIDDAGRLRVRTAMGIEILAGGIVMRD